MPFIITACVREVERRGVGEVGLYRVSGSASDVAKLRKSFESNSYEAEQLLKEVLAFSTFFCTATLIQMYEVKEKNFFAFTDTALCIQRWTYIQ